MSSRVLSFWSAFNAVENELFAQDIESISAWLRVHVRDVDPKIMWELAQQENGKYHLAFTCEQDYRIRPLIEELVEFAPRLQAWTFSTTKPPVPIEDLSEKYKTRSTRSLPNYSYSLSASPTNCIDIEICDLDGTESYNEWDVYLPLELALGEDLFEVWGGEITFIPLHSKTKFTTNFLGLRLCDLPVKFKELVDAILKETTPHVPYCQTVFSEPMELVSDDPLFERKPFETRAPRITEATFHYRFWSRRFSQFKEEVCFLKLSFTGQALSKSTLLQIENSVDIELKNKALGCAFASSVSNDFGYVDLILTDVDKSVILLKSILKDCTHASLGFYDQAYSSGRIPLV